MNKLRNYIASTIGIPSLKFEVFRLEHRKKTLEKDITRLTTELEEVNFEISESNSIITYYEIKKEDE